MSFSVTQRELIQEHLMLTWSKRDIKEKSNQAYYLLRLFFRVPINVVIGSEIYSYNKWLWYKQATNLQLDWFCGCRWKGNPMLLRRFPKCKLNKPLRLLNEAWKLKYSTWISRAGELWRGMAFIQAFTFSIYLHFFA